MLTQLVTEAMVCKCSYSHVHYPVDLRYHLCLCWQNSRLKGNQVHKPMVQNGSRGRKKEVPSSMCMERPNANQKIVALSNPCFLSSAWMVAKDEEARAQSLLDHLCRSLEVSPHRGLFGSGPGSDPLEFASPSALHTHTPKMRDLLL